MSTAADSSLSTSSSSGTRMNTIVDIPPKMDPQWDYIHVYHEYMGRVLDSITKHHTAQEFYKSLLGSRGSSSSSSSLALSSSSWSSSDISADNVIIYRGKSFQVPGYLTIRLKFLKFPSSSPKNNEPLRGLRREFLLLPPAVAAAIAKQHGKEKLTSSDRMLLARSRFTRERAPPHPPMQSLSLSSSYDSQATQSQAGCISPIPIPLTFLPSLPSLPPPSPPTPPTPAASTYKLRPKQPSTNKSATTTTTTANSGSSEEQPGLSRTLFSIPSGDPLMEVDGRCWSVGEYLLPKLRSSTIFTHHSTLVLGPTGPLPGWCVDPSSKWWTTKVDWVQVSSLLVQDLQQWAEAINKTESPTYPLLALSEVIITMMLPLASAHAQFIYDKSRTRGHRSPVISSTITLMIKQLKDVMVSTWLIKLASGRVADDADELAALEPLFNQRLEALLKVLDDKRRRYFEGFGGSAASNSARPYDREFHKRKPTLPHSPLPAPSKSIAIRILCSHFSSTMYSEIERAKELVQSFMFLRPIENDTKTEKKGAKRVKSNEQRANVPLKFRILKALTDHGEQFLADCTCIWPTTEREMVNLFFMNPRLSSQMFRHPLEGVELVSSSLRPSTGNQLDGIFVHNDVAKLLRSVAASKQRYNAKKGGWRGGRIRNRPIGGAKVKKAIIAVDDDDDDDDDDDEDAEDEKVENEDCDDENEEEEGVESANVAKNDHNNNNNDDRVDAEEIFIPETPIPFDPSHLVDGPDCIPSSQVSSKSLLFPESDDYYFPLVPNVVPPSPPIPPPSSSSSSGRLILPQCRKRSASPPPRPPPPPPPPLPPLHVLHPSPPLLPMFGPTLFQPLPLLSSFLGSLIPPPEVKKPLALNPDSTITLAMSTFGDVVQLDDRLILQGLLKNPTLSTWVIFWSRDSSGAPSTYLGTVSWGHETQLNAWYQEFMNLSDETRQKETKLTITVTHQDWKATERVPIGNVIGIIDPVYVPLITSLDRSFQEKLVTYTTNFWLFHVVRPFVAEVKPELCEDPKSWKVRTGSDKKALIPGTRLVYRYWQVDWCKSMYGQIMSFFQSNLLLPTDSKTKTS